MKTVIGVAIALALALSVVPAIAEEDTFQALSTMPAGEQGLLTPLSDEQLATIEGEGWGDRCTFCSNYAAVYQANVNYGFAKQRNVAVVKQEIN